MNVTYSYKITQMLMAPSLDGLTDVVTVVKFDYIGTDSDSGYDGTFNGSIPVGTPDPNNFVPLQDLTEDEVIQWVVATYPSWDHPQEVVSNQINNQITPENETAPMPWAPEPPEPLPPSDE
tara:strand:- start:183 stop:545 length:363 start_codon:yes stop_codon:yes gene_type:complete